MNTQESACNVVTTAANSRPRLQARDNAVRRQSSCCFSSTRLDQLDSNAAWDHQIFPTPRLKSAQSHHLCVPPPQRGAQHRHRSKRIRFANAEGTSVMMLSDTDIVFPYLCGLLHQERSCLTVKFCASKELTRTQFFATSSNKNLRKLDATRGCKRKLFVVQI